MLTTTISKPSDEAIVQSMPIRFCIPEGYVLQSALRAYACHGGLCNHITKKELVPSSEQQCHVSSIEEDRRVVPHDVLTKDSVFGEVDKAIKAR